MTKHTLTGIGSGYTRTLRNLADLIAAQLEYHKKAYEILMEVAPIIQQLQNEQEVRRHQSDDF